MGSLAGAAPGTTQATPSTLPNGPAGLTGLTPQQAAVDFGELTALGGGRSGYSLRSDPTNPENLLGLAAEVAPPKKVTTTCPHCGAENEVKHKDATCKDCGTKLQHEESEMAYEGNHFSQALADREMVLHLADSQPDDSDVSTVGSENVDATDPASIKCPECGKLNPQGATTCANCGWDLTGQTLMDAEQETAILHLSAEQLTDLDLADNAGQRQQWAKDGKALPDGSWPIPTVAYLKKACQAFPGRAKGNVGKIKSWILKRAKALGAEDIPELQRVKGQSVNADQREHNATLVALQLDHTQGDSGLIWKVLCKTGTLALSPGPGQMDTERPLNLTADMFKAVKTAYDERAFEHVTIPESHANGTLENCGTVDALDILSKQQALADTRLSTKTKDTFDHDPDSTLYMLGGMRFTDPKAKEKAQNGSILNCSVGLKFNYRRKRDGKLFPIALEHTALTNQPWVDGLGTFGGELAQPVDHEQIPVWDGVFVMPKSQDASTPSTASLSQAPDNGGLSRVKDDTQTGGGSTSTESTTPAAPAAGEHSLEQILASQQATIERLEREAQDARNRLELSQGQLDSQGFALHTARTNERVTELQRQGVPPAVLMRYKQLRLAAYHVGEGGTLQLSVKEGDSTVEKSMNPVEQAEFLLAAIPLGDPGENVTAITTGLVKAESLQLAQETSERQERSAAQKADDIERGLHPERFDDEGKRLAPDKRTAA